jgi:hypothetical protein
MQGGMARRGRAGHARHQHIRLVGVLSQASPKNTKNIEYVKTVRLVRELIWLCRIVQEVTSGLQVDYDPKMVVHSTIWEDNQGCIAVAKRPDLTACSRHILTKYHHFKENITVDASGNGITIAYCPSVDMQADIMTKGI